MKTALTQIGWGSYMQFEGPWFKGEHKMPTVEPHEPFDRKVLQVITSTEGSAFDAVNMYDRMIMTNGLIQWGDAGQYSVCDMLGAASEAVPSSLDDVLAHAADAGYTFGKNKRGRYRFSKDGNEVDTIEEQRELYLGGSSGHKNEWTDEQKVWAKRWACAIADVWDHEAARDAQVSFTVSRLKWFATKAAQTTLWDFSAQNADPAIVEATRAMYLSFAANLPVVAARQLAELQTNAPKWSLDWMIELGRNLTFGPKITIFPHRWNKIRPHLERLWGLDLPDFDVDLRKWQSEVGIDPRIPLETVHDVQNVLLYLGYDLGPSRADGVMGEKTKSALMMFQQLNGLKVDGIIGPKTRAALVACMKKVA